MRRESEPYQYRLLETGPLFRFEKGSAIYLYPSENSWGWQLQNSCSARRVKTGGGKRAKFRSTSIMSLYYNGNWTTKGRRTIFYASPDEAKKIRQ